MLYNFLYFLRTVFLPLSATKLPEVKSLKSHSKKLLPNGH